MNDGPEPQLIILSVHPRFAAALLDGTKTVEVRRRRAKLESGAVVLLYATTPQRELVGALRIASAEVAEPTEMWRRWGPHTALSRDEFDAYLKDRDEGCALIIDATMRFSRPIGLGELRARHAGFVTPQSYRFVHQDERDAILTGTRPELAELIA